MAASATLKSTIHFGKGFPQRKMEIGAITYDSDATVEVPTALKYIEHWTFGESGSGGGVDVPKLDETFTEAGGVVTVDADGEVTVDTAGSSSRVFVYQFIGY